MTETKNTNLQLYCAFSVRYTDDANGRKCVLQPGQVIPVWDAQKLCRCGPEVDIVLVTLTMNNGELEPGLGMPFIPAARYRAAKQLHEHAEQECQRILDQAALYELGGASTVSILRPHRLPVGIGLYNDVVNSWAPERQYFERGITYAKAFPMVETMERESSEFLPLPRLYVDGTKRAGFSVTESCEIVGLQESMLPVCPRPVQVDLMDAFAAAVEHFNRLGTSRVYLGFDIPEAASAQVSAICDKQVTAEEVRNHKHPGPKMYTIPHGTRDYYEGIRRESMRRLDLLLQGIDEEPAELVYGTKGPVHLVFQPLGETLEEAAFST